MNTWHAYFHFHHGGRSKGDRRIAQAWQYASQDLASMRMRICIQGAVIQVVGARWGCLSWSEEIYGVCFLDQGILGINVTV